MSEAQEVAQPATSAQEAGAQAIINAQKQAYQDMQANMQIELQMRVAALTAAVNLYEGGSAVASEEVSKAATTFLKFLKQGEASNG
jgi:hypothetical protein